MSQGPDEALVQPPHLVSDPPNLRDDRPTMGKKEKAELAARRKSYFERYGTQVPVPPGITLPPGFLTATPLLHALLTFTPPPDIEHERDLYPARSPAMTNNRGPPGVRRGWEAGMPISDAFLRFEDEAINARQTGKTSLSPRELLGQIGAKYDQYLGYRQQDAHELLRHLLDGMRMEEMDIIKKRNPPPPKSKSKSKLSRPSSPDRLDSNKPSTPPEPGGPDAQTARHDASPDPAAASVPEDPFIPFADMVFGGTLASILVCEGCKHISHTYEDFMDLSLSIKPEDAREKKRDKFKFFHKFRKGTAPFPTRTPPPTMTPVQPAIPFPSTEMDVSSAAVSNNPSTVDVYINGAGGVEVVPNGLTAGSGKDDRRVSAGSAPGLAVSDGETSTTQPRARVSSVQISTEEGHDRDDSSTSGVGARIGRRVSLQGWKKKDKDKDKEKSKERAKSKERPSDKKDDKAGKDTEDERDKAPRSRPPSPTFAPMLMEPNASSAAVSRSQSPSRKNEAAYMRKVLADVGAPPTNPLALLKGAADGLGMLKDPFARPSMDDVWLKLGSGRGSIPDALRSFTAVEVLEGNNAFACRRCWKIAHGIPVGRARKGAPGVNGTNGGQRSKDSVGTTTASDASYDSDSSSSDSDSELSSEGSSLLPPAPLGVPPRPASTSGVGTGPGQWASDTAPPRPSSAPMVEDRALTMPIPTIEMTSPDAERARPFLASPPPAPPVLARTPTQGSAETESSAVTFESAQSTAATSGPGPTIAAPVPRTPIALRSTTLPTNANAALPAIPRSQQYIHRRALKRYLIATPPPVLVIHLKRFHQVAGAGTLLFGNLRKLDDFVAFPEVLDIAPFVAPNREEYGMGRAKKTVAARANDKVTTSGPGLGWFGRGKEKEKAVKYKLYAVVVHIGSMLGGHYIAYIALPPMPPPTSDGEDAPAVSEDPAATKGGDTKDKDKDGKDKDKRQWVYISDTTVRPVSFEEVSKAKAYLCFYERFYD
ncbi:hypothetical protein FRC10_010617 [Ceratobasidium sp. 414]|nr:hypothetical protein FRC10_010617 [Ceratobasidium sp. 414]